MKVTEAVVFWRPAWRGRPSVRVERNVSGYDRDRDEMWRPIKPMDDPTKQGLAMFMLFHAITVRDGVPTSLAHKAFLKIDEYRETLLPEGA
jgi:hypothetical protein